MDEEKNIENEHEISMGDLWAVFRHCWWIMAIVAVVAFVVLFVFMKATYKPVYTAEARVYVLRSLDGTNGGTSTSDVSIANQFVNDSIVFLKEPEVLNRVIYDQNLIMDYKTLARKIQSKNEEGTRLIHIYVTAASAAEASNIAKSLSLEICNFLNNDMYEGEKWLKPVGEPVTPTRPSNPISKMKIALISFVCALVVYAVYVVLFIMDDKINGPEDVEKYLGLSILGQIPNKHDASRRKKYHAYATDSPKAS